MVSSESTNPQTEKKQTLLVLFIFLCIHTYIYNNNREDNNLGVGTGMEGVGRKGSCEGQMEERATKVM